MDWKHGVGVAFPRLENIIHAKPKKTIYSSDEAPGWSITFEYSRLWFVSLPLLLLAVFDVIPLFHTTTAEVAVS